MVTVNKSIKSNFKAEPATPKRRPRKKLNSSIDWSGGYDHESIRPAVTALVERYLANAGASDTLLEIKLAEDAGVSSEFALGVYVCLKEDTDDSIQAGLLEELTQKLRRVIMREYNWNATKDWIADNNYKMNVEIGVGDCYDNDTEYGYDMNYRSDIVVECPVEFNSSRKKGNTPMRKGVSEGKLNSSRKPVKTAARNPFLRKLNSSKLTGSTFDGKTYDEARNILMSDEYGYDMLWDYFGEYMPKLGEEVGKQVDMQFDETADVFFNTMAECSTEEEFIRKIQEQLQKYSSLSMNSSEKGSSNALNCSSGESVTVTTESGNEVSMQDIKIVQNPSTNELALFIPENDEDIIPEGFTVIGDVVSAGGEEDEDSEEDESEKSEELDSSKKTGMNCDYSEGDCFAALWPAYIDDSYKCACCGKSFPAGHNSVQLGGHKPDGMHFIYEYTKDNRVGNSVNYDPYNLPPEDSEGGVFKVIVGEEADDEGYRWLDFCRNCWPKLTSKSPEEIYAEYSVPEKKKE